MSQKTLRCAVYTRKSSEEGLDQNFNSLDAQREACEAYIASQRHEGWRALSKRYDDGGFSGGNMQRPGLQQLLTDINAGHVDLVVVYKIDRLTRSLTDFAKMVEVFEKKGTSFVSVTQHFNTTTSMGRLTLNVLLSFAQFEREVTGERIRDKFAASKVKGLWMGGPIPLGYDVKDRALVANPKDAAIVRSIFDRYLTLCCVQNLKDELDAKGFKTKVRVSRAGNRSGGTPFARGAIYHLLRNRLYRGETHHAGKYYPGQHEAIVPADVWEKVQAQLDTNHRAHHVKERARVSNLLAGMVFSEEGLAFIGKHTTKQGRKYRYYWLKAAVDTEEQQQVLSIPAYDLERLIETEWIALLTSKDLDQRLGIERADHAKLIRGASRHLASTWNTKTASEKREALTACGTRIHVRTGHVDLSIEIAALCKALLGPDTTIDIRTGATRLSQSIAASNYRVRGGTRLIEADDSARQAATAPGREQLLRTVAIARKWMNQLITGEVESMRALAAREKRSETFLSDTLRVACLSPKLVQALVDGQGLSITGTSSLLKQFKSDWAVQDQLMGKS
jgi:site-specific DNA recombinase